MARYVGQKPPKGEMIRDRADRPVIGYVRRDTLVADRWVGRPIRMFRQVHMRFDPDRGRVGLHKRASILFVGSSKWHESRDVYARPADGKPLVPIMKALKDFSQESWWVSKKGEEGSEALVIERRATLYEESMPDSPPFEKWALMPSAVVSDLIGYAKSTYASAPAPKSDTDEAHDAARALSNHERALQRAKAGLQRHEEQLAFEQSRVAAYSRKVTRLEALVSLRRMK